MSQEDEKLRQFYDLEKSLAEKIKQTPRSERTKVTMDAYNQVLQSIPWHPMLNETDEYVAAGMRSCEQYLAGLLDSSDVILEIGCGRGKFTRRLSSKVSRVVGLDISKEILPDPADKQPDNVSFVIGDACYIPEGDKYDLVFSNQLIEHLHPEDVTIHLKCVHERLKPGGRYAFITPSSLTGPHDVSKHFDDVATGFHLKEWTYQELCDELREAGFSDIRARILPDRLVNSSATLARLALRPIRYKIALEKTVGKLPKGRLRKKISNVLKLSSVFIVAQRPKS